MIDVVDLTKTFPGAAEPVLGGISLSIRRGEVFGIIGRSGAGKSTLVRCIDLLETPTSGSIRIDGEDVSSLRGSELRAARRRIGVVFQGFNLLSSRTAYENVALPLELVGASRGAIRSAVEPLLGLVGLAAKRDRYPSELSGGEKQRVGIARALASRPSVLLCDEATSALDPETTESILSLLGQINRELSLTIVLVTHEMDVVKRACDRVAVLDRGRVVEHGQVFDVFASPVHEVTRSFLHGSSEREVVHAIAEQAGRVVSAGLSVRLVRVTTVEASADLAVFGDVTRRWPVALRIVAGGVERIRASRYGRLVVELEGKAGDLQSAVTRIKAAGFDVETLREEDGDARAVA